MDMVLDGSTPEGDTMVWVGAGVLVRLREALCCEVQTTSRGTVAAVVCGLQVRRAAIVDLQRQRFAQADVKT